MIYLDNAATSFPKPFEVKKAFSEALSVYGANPGRSSHEMSLRTGLKVYEARNALNEFFGGYQPDCVSFTCNCTYALNMCIKGIVKPGDHVIISSLEHNSVARPVEKLKRDGIISYSVFEVVMNDDETVENFRRKINARTRAAVVTAVSNVFGNILPLERIGKLCRENGIVFIVDGAQAAGCIELNMKKMNIDCLCVPGHKGLLGPMGTGALLHNGVIKNTLIQGGNGTESLKISSLGDYPEMLECGTLNVPGICALKAGVDFVNGEKLSSVFDYETSICRQFFYDLKSLPKIKLFRDEYDEKHFAPIVSFNVEGMHSEEVAAFLDRNSVAVRGGYHCAALAHRYAGSETFGAVRVSPSTATSKKDLNNVLNLLSGL